VAIFSYAQIQEMLPHRYPMLMVDSVLSLEPRQSIVATKCVTGNEPCYAAMSAIRSCRQTAYPVSLIIESFSQAGVILWMQSAPAQCAGSVLMFGLAKDCDFDGDVFPGDTMQHRVNLDSTKGDNLFFSGETWVAERRVARLGWLMAVTRPFSALAR
jgi:3-hydroxyacyl-[acyl-carrier-protein] dehydratase